MTRLKTLSLPAIAAVLAASAPEADAQVDIALRVNKTFRQYGGKRVDFLNGQFNIDIWDGNAVYGCSGASYFSPSIPCPDGATGFVGFGNIDPDVDFPISYLEIFGIQPAVAIAPKFPERCILKAAPNTTMERPVTGFTDSSYSIFYNIAPGSVAIREYLITRYDYTRNYTGTGGGNRLKKEIIPGQYIFALPLLSDPNKPLGVPLVHYDIPDGYEKIGNVKQGFRFVKLPGKLNRRGFVLVDKNKIPTFKWEGLSRTKIYPGSDRLYFSIRNMENPNNAASRAIYQNGGNPVSIFPGVVSGADPRVLLENALVNNYTLPPLVRTGSKGVAELELARNVTTNGVTYDNSSRRYQLPVWFVDQYSEFKKVAFRGKKQKNRILDDFDNDGFNNLTEWVLETRANDTTSFPGNPLPAYNPPVPGAEPEFFGFQIFKREGLVPAVRYQLQRSINNGRTWSNFSGDADWAVVHNRDYRNYPRLRLVAINSLVRPPGTENQIFRVKITLRYR